MGIKHLMMRDPKTSKFERVAKNATDPKVAEAQIDAALASGNSFWIYTKDPSVQAFTDLMNRALNLRSKCNYKNKARLRSDGRTRPMISLSEKVILWTTSQDELDDVKETLGRE